MFLHPFATAILCVAALSTVHAHAQDSVLPDPLTRSGGGKVATAAAWKDGRRGEVLELFRTNVYGRAPIGRPESLKFETLETNPTAMEGKATLKRIKVSFTGPHGEGAIRLTLFTPNGRSKPAPCMMLICNRPESNIDPTRAEKSPFWPAEQMIARGYAAAAFFNGDVAPDKKDAWKSGVHAMFDPEPRTADAWGTIAAWAWGASRCLDYLVTDPAVDAKRIAVVGHSRGGKTALWAGAEDERFAMVVSNCSGSTGAAIARGKSGESIAKINTSFPHWFCENYKKFNDRETELPVDQHMLAALIAPRLLYIASASEDAWADPKNEFRCGVEASPVYRLFGLKGLVGTAMPAGESPLHEGEIGYHIHTGKHDLTEYDWKCYMDFADRHFGKK